MVDSDRQLMIVLVDKQVDSNMDSMDDGWVGQ